VAGKIGVFNPSLNGMGSSALGKSLDGIRSKRACRVSAAADTHTAGCVVRSHTWNQMISHTQIPRHDSETRKEGHGRRYHGPSIRRRGRRLLPAVADEGFQARRQRRTEMLYEWRRSLMPSVRLV